MPKGIKGFTKGISGSPKTQFKKGHKVSNNHKEILRKRFTGRKLLQETKEKLSKNHSGKKHWNWQGGKSSLAERIRKIKEYKEWRKSVYERDNYICIVCNKNGGKLNADHIRPFNKLLEYYNIKTLKDARKCKELWNINNGRTLCLSCHRKTDTYAGKAKYYFDLNLIGKKALITGGSKGIGLAIKEALEKEGVECISWSRSEGIDFDIGIPLQDVQQLKNIDIIINNFGGGGTWKSEDANKVMDRNYGLTQCLTREWLKYKKKWGRVITIASIYGTYPGHNPEFASAKAAQIMFMKSLALKNNGITFNCVSPSEVADAGTPKKVKLKSKDVANLVTFLCSDKAKFINGQNIVI